MARIEFTFTLTDKRTFVEYREHTGEELNDIIAKVKEHGITVPVGGRAAGIWYPYHSIQSIAWKWL